MACYIDNGLIFGAAAVDMTGMWSLMRHWRGIVWRGWGDGCENGGRVDVGDMESS